MKPLAAYTLFLGMTMTAFFASVNEEKPSYHAQLEPIILEFPVKLSESLKLPTRPIALKEQPSHKSYSIFFENKSVKTLKVATHYKSLGVEWHTNRLLTLAPGERKLMGKSQYRTYFYHIAQKDKSKNTGSESDFKLPLRAGVKKKVVLKKKKFGSVTTNKRVMRLRCLGNKGRGSLLEAPSILNSQNSLELLSIGSHTS